MAFGTDSNNQPPLHPAGMAKRPRPDYGFPPAGMHSGPDLPDYFPGENRAVKDTQDIGSAYDRYLQSKQPPFGHGEHSGNFGGRGGIGIPGFPPMGEPPMMGGPRSIGSDMVTNGRGGMGFGGPQHPMDLMPRPGRDMPPLPPDATKTLFIEGLPSNTTKREVAHIFRPFLGYTEVRLVSKASKHRGGDPLILCFVDFEDPACAANALNALQGYKMDEHEPDSHILRLEFAKNPGRRSGPRGNR